MRIQNIGCPPCPCLRCICIVLVGIAALGLILSIPIVVHAQEPVDGSSRAQIKSPPPIFRHLSQRNGLSHHTIRNIIQDTRGYLWFGTLDGLDRFDGYAVRSFRYNPDNDSSLCDNQINALLQSNEGMIWVGTQVGVCVLDPHTEKFLRIPLTDSPSLTERIVARAFLQAKDDTLWIATDDGLFRRDSKSGTVSQYRHDDGNPNSLAFDDLYGLAEDADGRIWIATFGGGVDALNPAAGQFTHYRKDANDPESLNNNGALSVFIDSANQVWVGTWGGGLNRLDPRTGKFAHYLNSPTDPTTLSSNLVQDIISDRAGDLWVATYGGGLNRFDFRNETFTRYLHDPADLTSISHNNLLSLFPDNSGLLWIGTEGGGISILDLSPKPFAFYRPIPSDANTLTAGAVTAITKDTDGALWIGTSSGGLDHLDRKTLTYTHYRNDSTVASSLSSSFVGAVLLDRQGNLWVGTGAGLDRFDRATNRFKSYRHDENDITSLSDSSVYALLQDSDGTLWVGTYNGLNHFEPQSGKSTRFLHDPDDPNTLTSNLISELKMDAEGSLWVGTDKGLNRLDRASGKFTRFQHDPTDTTSMSGDYVSALLADPNGALWVATWGYGLNKFDPKTGQFKRYAENDGLATGRTMGLMLDPAANDGAGDLWISTGRGLSRLNLRDETIRNYDSGDGLPENGFVINSYFQADDGEMFAGGTEGLVAFYPSEIRTDEKAPSIALTKFFVNNQLAQTDPNGPLTRALDDSKEITLPPGTQSFALEFAALDYREPDNTLYRYRLDGFDRDWIHVNSSQRQVTYTNLDPGTYTFRVTGANGDGVWSEQERTLAITIEPMWWQTSWASGLALLALGGLVLGLIWGRGQIAAQRQRSLESEVAQRTNELTQLFAVSGSLTGALQLKPLLQEILDSLNKILPYSAASVIVREGDELVVTAARANELPDPTGNRYPINAISPFRRLIAEGKPFLIEDLEQEPVVVEQMTRAIKRAPRTRAWLGVPLIIHDQVTGLLFLKHMDAGRYIESDIPRVQSFANFAAFAIENARLSEQAQQAAVSEERNRLARDLHDSVTQSLYGITLYANAAERALDSGEDQIGTQHLEELKRLASEATLEMRMLIFEMRPTILEDKGLAAALKARLDAVEARSEMQVKLDVRGERRLPTQMELELYRIAQEALANISKHARATEVAVHLEFADDRVVMQISDNGLGFVLAQAQEKGTVGLHSMQERAAKLGGSLDISTSPQSGTTIRVEVPYG